MPTNNPPSFRFSFEPQIANLPPEIQQVHRATFNALTDLYQGLAALKGQISAKTGTTGTGTTIENVATENVTIGGSTTTGVTFFNSATGAITYFPGMGYVNLQTGVTSYTTQASDNGKMIVLNDSSPIAVTLNSGYAPPWFTSISNQGTGSATLTPTSGTINNLASILLPAQSFTSVWFDGVNWWTSVPPVIFSRGGTILTPTGAVNVVVWYAPFSCTVTNVLGYVAGSTGSVINAQINGSLPLLVSNLTLSSANTWTDGGAVQNTAVSVGDKIEIMVISVSGTPTEIAVEIQLTRP